MLRPPFRPRIILPALVLASLSPLATWAEAQDPSTPQLSISKIIYEPPATTGGSGTLRVTVANASGHAATPSDRPTTVKLTWVDPSGRTTSLETNIRASIPGGATQTGIISVTPIYMDKTGTHTLTAWAVVPAGSGNTGVIRSPDKVEKVIVGNPPR